jgi:hypothetical protein
MTRGGGGSAGVVAGREEAAGPNTTLRSVEKHFQEKTAEPQISPLRFASVEMTKGRVALPGRVVAELKFLGPLCPCGRDDHPGRSVAGILASPAQLSRARPLLCEQRDRTLSRALHSPKKPTALARSPCVRTVFPARQQPAWLPIPYLENCARGPGAEFVAAAA